MSISVNTFYAYLSQQLVAGGSETTIYLDRITTRTGETINTSDFSAIGRGIIAVNPDGDGNTSFPEYISFTGVFGLTLTGATRGLSAKGNSVIASNKRFHPVGTPVVISFGAHSLQDIFDYIDNEIGALTVGSNMVMSGLAGETVSAGQVVYLKDDGRWWLADADLVATINEGMLGIAQGSGTAGNTITNGVLRKGTDSNQSGLTAGANYFVGNTAGAVSATAGTNTRKIGVGRSSTQLYFDPEYAQLPSSGEKAAMAGGSGYGTPGGTNPFMTRESVKDSSVVSAPVIRVYTSTSSPHTWTKPANLKYIRVRIVGAGGDGATDGAGGGGGGYAEKIIAAASLGATETITLGAGGVGTGNSTFGSILTVGNGADASGTSGGAGGSATGGDVNIAGQNGSDGEGGKGGDSILGFGGVSPYQTSSTNVASGQNGSGYGGGGGGGQTATDGTPSGGAGGTGSTAGCIVEEHFI